MVLLFVLLAWTVTAAGAAQPASLVRNGGYVALEYLYDSTGQHGVDDVLSLDLAAWKQLPEGFASFGFDTGYYWFRWRLRSNSTEQDTKRLLEISYPLLDEIDLFAIVREANGKETMQQWKLGDKLPFETRPYHHRNFVIPFETPPLGSIEFISRIHSSSSLQVPIRLWTIDDFQRDEQMSLLEGVRNFV